MSEKHSLEFNKIAAGILLAGVIAMVSGILADGFYNPKTPEKRGFHVEVAEDAAGGGDAAPAPEVDVGTLLASADAAKGESIVQKKCTSCHDFSQGGPDKTGPNLYGIIGSKIAHKDGYSYSDAVKNHGGTWGYEEINHWLHGPAQFIKGNKMGFAGLKNDQERADVIMYLKSISPSAPAIPAPQPAAAAAPADKASGPGPVDNGKNVQNKVNASKDVKNPDANKEAQSGATKGALPQAVKQESQKATNK